MKRTIYFNSGKAITVDQEVVDMLMREGNISPYQQFNYADGKFNFFINMSHIEYIE